MQEPQEVHFKPTFSRNLLNVEMKLIDKEFIENFGAPGYAKQGDAGMDLRANLTPLVGKEGVRTDGGTLIINPGQTILIPTGVAIYIANPSFVGLLHPRSGLGHKEGLVLGNLTGIIDSSYQGQLMVSMWNRSNSERAIKHGDRIAQYLIMPVFGACFNVVEEFSEVTIRADGGFGHSGKD